MINWIKKEMFLRGKKQRIKVDNDGINAPSSSLW